MFSRSSFAGWYRNRFVWVGVILLAASATAVVLVNTAGSEARPADLKAQLTSRIRGVLEQADASAHQHQGHHAANNQQAAGGKVPVVCGVNVYGFEPPTAAALTEVKTVYAFHLCGVAEQNRPWDWAVKLAGPVIMDMSTDPPGIQVVEATAEVRFVDRLREMFPEKYEEQALKEALPESEMADLRRRYDSAAGL
ncbi:hypothetical protein [Plantactinospora sonchi]|uniref:DUF3105 domain-containing protein n=1 Tax=Plantactinospora sonchi TaxID=1544735 RepID=A0ABU7S3I9_9ACTN